MRPAVEEAQLVRDYPGLGHLRGAKREANLGRAQAGGVSVAGARRSRRMA